MGSVPYKALLSYNGAAFAGFQRQAKKRTVQGEFESALTQLGWQDQSILGAGRTDAGVHARGQVVSFKLSWNHTPDDLQNALNYYLPEDMVVRSVSIVPADFHPRYDAISRRYRYSVICQPVRDPLREGFAWRVWPTAHLEPMQAAAQALVGVHDFKAFGTPTSDSGVTVRELFSAEWVQQEDALQFDITANAFLYHMVRRITMALVRIGQGEAPESVITESLSTGQMIITGLAPAAGLVLEEVIYR